MDVVCFGQQNWDVCWTGKQHLMTRLARRGHRVLYVDPTVAAGESSLAQLEPGLWRFAFTRHAPPQEQQQTLAEAARKLLFVAPVALVMLPMDVALRDAVKPQACVYYAVDEWTAFGGLSATQRLTYRQQEEELLRHSDVALGASPRLVRRFAQLNARAYLQENGVDTAFYNPARLATLEPHPQVAALPRPRLCFVGQVDERLDQAMLMQIARARPQWSIVLAGRVKDGVDVSRLAQQPNIHLLGYQPYAILPSIMREADVCIVPYRSTSLTEACNPLKIYEYLATGRPVVSTPLDGLGMTREAIVIAIGAQTFIAAVETALACPAAGRPRRLALAAACDWELRTDELERRLDEAMRVGSRQADGGQSRWLDADEAAGVLRLDEKDEAERQVNNGFAREGLSLMQRIMFEGLRGLGLVRYGARVLRRWVSGSGPLDIQRILIVRSPVYVGDLVALVPMLEALRRRWPEAHITLGVQSGASAAAILENRGLIDEARPLNFCDAPDRRTRMRGMWQLFNEGYDLLLTGAWYFTRPEGFFSGAPYRVGLYDGHVLQRLCNALVPLDANRHEADNNLALAEALGCKVDADQRGANLAFDQQEVWKAGLEVMRLLGIGRDADVVTVHAGSKRHSRRWPADRFAGLINRLLSQRPRLHVVLTGVADEQDLAESIRGGVNETLRPRVHNAAAKTDIIGLIGLLERSCLVVSNDTGVMHLARARERPLLALLGPENERRWGPLPSGKGQVIAIRHEVPCAPCFRQTCEGHYCMRALTVDAVHDAAGRLLNGHGTTGEAAARHTPPAPAHEYQIHKHRWGWRDLHDAGHSVPAVSVVIDGRDERWPLRLAELSQQDYPHAHPIVILNETERVDGLEEVSQFARDVQFVRAGDGGTLWQRVGRLVRGQFVAIMPAAAAGAGDSQRLSRVVAALLRSPGVQAVQGKALRRLIAGLDEQALAEPLTFRAELLWQARSVLAAR